MSVWVYAYIYIQAPWRLEEGIGPLRIEVTGVLEPPVWVLDWNCGPRDGTPRAPKPFLQPVCLLTQAGPSVVPAGYYKLLL